MLWKGLPKMQIVHKTGMAQLLLLWTMNKAHLKYAL